MRRIGKRESNTANDNTTIGAHGLSGGQFHTQSDETLRSRFRTVERQGEVDNSPNRQFRSRRPCIPEKLNANSKNLALAPDHAAGIHAGATIRPTSSIAVSIRGGRVVEITQSTGVSRIRRADAAGITAAHPRARRSDDSWTTRRRRRVGGLGVSRSCGCCDSGCSSRKKYVTHGVNPFVGRKRRSPIKMEVLRTTASIVLPPNARGLILFGQAASADKDDGPGC